MALTIPIAHDFCCPWCYVAVKQVRRLQAEHGIEVDWRGYELFPRGMHWPDYPVEPRVANKPKTPSRFDFFAAAEGVTMPDVDRPSKMRTYNAHQAVEHVRASGGDVDTFVETLYRAYYERAENINEIPVLKRLAAPFVADLNAFVTAIEDRAYDHRIVLFDDDAHAKGVFNVPTYFIDGQRYAEQPYAVLSEAVKKAKGQDYGTAAYQDLVLPDAVGDRPYTVVVMVQTIDGKILGGERTDPVGLGSRVDQELLRRIQRATDAVLIGASTLRAAPTWNPQTDRRIVVTKSGELPADAEFFSKGTAYVAVPGSSSVSAPGGAKLIRAGDKEVDYRLLLERLRTLGVERLAVLGGSETNAKLIAGGLVDEIFVTIAPKVRLGRDIPTLADGTAFPPGHSQAYELAEHHVVGSEIFLRYRRSGK